MPAPLFIGFDIETRPRVDLVDRFAKPFPEFDESAVKYGNTKDPVKRAELLSSKRAEHEAERDAYWANLRERAALDPFTGEIICIGLITDQGKIDIVAEKDEMATIRQFWQVFGLAYNATTKFVFWSGCGDPAKKFDIDYIVTRSRILGVSVPQRVRSGRFYADRVVDLASEFLLFQRDRYLTLTKAADILGVYSEYRELFPKRDDDPVTGANFFQWWDGTAQTDVPAAEQRAFAEKYLRNDLLHLPPLALRILF
jgi:hypothetical protein